MRQSHQTRGKSLLRSAALAVLLCVGALMIPEAWLQPLRDNWGSSEPAAMAFHDATIRLDERLESGDAELDEAAVRKLIPYVVARRLTRAGPLTSEQMEQIAQWWADAMARASEEGTDGAPEAHYVLVREKIVDEHPRLDPTRANAELDRFQEQLAKTLQPPPGGNGSLDCGSCHSDTRVLPGDLTFDATGIYPFIGTDEAFDGGRRLPFLVESIELQARRKSDPELRDVECLSCHVPHGSSDFELRHTDRVQNMGLWVKTIDTTPSVVHVEAKLKNLESGHRAPAGHPRSAYVVTVDAYQSDQRLTQRYGSMLPRHLRRDGGTAGVVYARHLVDEAGEVTTDIDAARDLWWDSRLESGRFAEEHFLFDRLDTTEVKLDIVLWHLPDYATWQNARAVRKVRSTERRQLK